MLISQVSKDPLTPNYVVRVHLRNEILKSGAKELAFASSSPSGPAVATGGGYCRCSGLAYIFDGFLQEPFVLFDEINGLKVAVE